jgi:hypothetical protein
MEGDGAADRNCSKELGDGHSVFGSRAMAKEDKEYRTVLH